MVVHFSRPPAPHPRTLCFHFPGTLLTHRQVLDGARARLRADGGLEDHVDSVQFLDRNVLHGSQGLDNRWLVTMRDAQAVDRLLLLGMQFFNRSVVLRRYDDVLAEEYEEYLSFSECQRVMFPGGPAEEEANLPGSKADGARRKSLKHIPFRRVLSRTQTIRQLKMLSSLSTGLRPNQEQSISTLVSEVSVKDHSKTQKKN